MSTVIDSEIEHLGLILQRLTQIHVIRKTFGDTLPYRWELVSRMEPQRYVGTIQLSASDILSLHLLTDERREAYLLERFGDLL